MLTAGGLFVWFWIWVNVSPLALNDVETRPAMPARSERRRSEYPVCVTDAVRVGPVALPELVAFIL